MAGDDAAGDGELAARGAAYIEGAVSLVRDKAVRPLLIGARVAVIGLVAVAVGLVLATAAVIGLVRLFTADVFAGRVWATDLLFGVVLFAAGLVLMWLGFRPHRKEEA